MEDPTRIPTVIETLREVWEAQPDLPLATLWEQARNAGVGWGTDDEALHSVLKKLLELHPASVTEDSPHLYCCETQAGDNAGPEVTLHPKTRTIVVISKGRQPTAWTWGKLAGARVGLPLRVCDEEGVSHRYGVVRGFTALKTPRPPRPGFTVADLGEKRWLFRLSVARENGADLPATAVLGNRLSLWVKGRRAVEYRELRWRTVLDCDVGADLVVTRGSGASPDRLGRIVAVLPLGGPPAVVV